MHNTRVRLTRRRLYLEKRFHESKQMVATRNPGDIIAKTREVTASHVGRNTAEISRSIICERISPCPTTVAHFLPPAKPRHSFHRLSEASTCFSSIAPLANSANMFRVCLQSRLQFFGIFVCENWELENSIGFGEVFEISVSKICFCWGNLVYITIGQFWQKLWIIFCSLISENANMIDLTKFIKSNC